MAATVVARRWCRTDWFQQTTLSWTKWASQCFANVASADVHGLDAVVGRAQASMEPAPGRGIPTLLVEDTRYNSNKHKVCCYYWERCVLSVSSTVAQFPFHSTDSSRIRRNACMMHLSAHAVGVFHSCRWAAISCNAVLPQKRVVKMQRCSGGAGSDFQERGQCISAREDGQGAWGTCARHVSVSAATAPLQCCAAHCNP